jgi:hypothetical protein
MRGGRRTKGLPETVGDLLFLIGRLLDKVQEGRWSGWKQVAAPILRNPVPVRAVAGLWREVTVRQPLSLIHSNPNPKVDSLVNLEQLHLLRAIFQGCDDRHAASLSQAPTIARL